MCALYNAKVIYAFKNFRNFGRKRKNEILALYANGFELSKF